MKLRSSKPWDFASPKNFGASRCFGPHISFFADLVVILFVVNGGCIRCEFGESPEGVTGDNGGSELDCSGFSATDDVGEVPVCGSAVLESSSVSFGDSTFFLRRPFSASSLILCLAKPLAALVPLLDSPG